MIRVLKLAIGLCIALLAGGAAYEAWTRHAAAREFPPRGKLVDIGGRRLQMDCRGIGTITPRVDVSWQSQQDFDPAPGAEAPQPEFIIKPYAITNAQVDYVPTQGKWTATAGVTNVTDEFYYYQLFNGGAVNIASNVAPPREYFFSVRRDF